MPMTIFDWVARTAMLVMAGLVTLSILGAIAAMTNDPGTRFAAPGDRPVVEGEQAEQREAVPASPAPGPSGEGNLATAPDQGQRGTIVAAPPPIEDKVARWLEAIAYALLALVGVAALGVLMLLSLLRELRRIGRSQQ
ncbi:MAG TPA: hypothetical protein VF605_09925 [Allosphingosinicella sp.]|jgi:hypothetical protein